MSEGRQPTIRNREAFHHYEILETFEAGIVLAGTEVKSIREGKANLRDAYATIKDGEVWLQDAHIAPYASAGYAGHDPTRDRKLLLHKKEIRKIAELLGERGLTLVPLSMYFKRGRAKVELGVGRGLKSYDKRHKLKEQDQKLDMQRALRRGA